jgi:1-acyl-sn-glycerol-3-phosphate acyltransferase
MESKFDFQSQLGWSLDDRHPQATESFLEFCGWFYQHYFCVQTAGWEQIPTHQNVLFVGSHNGGLSSPDMIMMIYDWFQRFGYEHPVYGLMHPYMWKFLPPHLAQVAAQMGAITAHPRMAIAALRQGASVLVYPGGARDVFRPHALRHQIYLDDNQAFIKLALREQVPIVPLISHGAHDTLLVLGDIYPMMRQLHEWGMPWPFGLDPIVLPIYLGLPWGLAIGPWPHIPLPIQIHTRVCEPITFERYGEAAARDRCYVQACYEIVKNQMQQELDQLLEDCVS